MEVWIPIAVLLLVFVGLYFFLQTGPVTEVVLEAQDGRTAAHERVDRSSGQPGGIEFSYTGWVRIDDFQYRHGTERVIFVKGTPDLSLACPALVIDANTNTLLVKMDTFGAQEIIPVVSVPDKKWLHFAIVCTQEKLEVYINGVIYAHHALVHLPKLNSGSVLTSPGGGFKGKVSKIEYHPRALSVGDIASMSSEIPPGSDSNDLFSIFSPMWYARTR